ncbi:MAG: hypothetical protein QUS14_14325 [Pyrinomonadaceae bacterium]|nr:hypothetical protein [Pyrinomonadaceae bacterium]
MILSLVYDRGTILASKRTPYGDLIAQGFDEGILEERLNRQHKLMCAAIMAGRLEDLKKLASKDSAGKTSTGNGRSKGSKQKSIAELVTSSTPETELSYEAELLPVPRPDSGPLIMPIPKPDLVGLGQLEALMLPAEPLVDVVSVIDSDAVLPDTAITAIESEMAGFERPANNHLTVEIFGDTEFRGGEKRSVGVMVCRGTDRKIVARAQIMVKIIGSSFRPLIYHAETDSNGIARLEFDVPKFKSGRAAFLVRAMSGGEATELRQQVMHA